MDAGDEPEIGETVFKGKAVASVDLDGLVECAQRGVGGGELGHVGRLGGVLAAVRHLGGAHRHQARHLHVDRRLGEWVGNALMCADRLLPNRARGRILNRAIDGVTRHSVVQCGNRDALGVESDKYLPQTVAFRADECVWAEFHLVEEEHELLVGRLNDVLDRLHRDAGSIRSDDEQRQRMATVGSGDRSTRHHEDGVRLVHR